jgi:flavin-dependent dehydrogenase
VLLSTVQGRVRSNLPESAMWAVYHCAVTPFYGWLIPQGGAEFLLGFGAPAALIKRDNILDGAPAGAWNVLAPYMEYIRARGYVCEALEPKPRGCPLTWTTNMRGLWWGEGGVHALGEAAGLVSPSSGGGIHYALAHAAALAQALLEQDAGSGRNALDQRAVTARVQALLAPQLAHLRFSCLKAWTAARPRLRGWATRLLPILQRQHIERLPW